MRRPRPTVTLRRRCGAAVLVTALAAVSCSGGGSPIQPPVGPGTNNVAAAYIESLLGLMQANSMRRLEIDWATFGARVTAEAAGAATIPDTYPAIRLALELLADGHSFYRMPSGTLILSPRRTCTASPVTQPSVPPGIGYVRVTSFSGTAAQALTFANGIRHAIADADREDLAGWIVDLRGNGGGNMWPMLAGLGPVLGDGVAGYFIDPLGQEIVWEYRDGGAWLGGQLLQTVSTPYQLKRPWPRVAVLTDNWVASSGEAVAIAFRGRPATRSFGSPTCGVSTANRAFPMSDGAELILTVSVMADRTKTAYGDEVVPDERVPDGDATVQRAITWLQTGS
jgi:carboxyl-terminal processing protease